LSYLAVGRFLFCKWKLNVWFSQKYCFNTVLATSLHNIVTYSIIYYLLQHTVLNEYICGQWRSKGGEVVRIYSPGRRRLGRINTLCRP